MAMDLDSPTAACGPDPVAAPAPAPSAGSAAAAAAADAAAPTPAAVFDLETYIARYAPLSETRLQRLLLIAQSKRQSVAPSPSPSSPSPSPSSERSRLAFGLVEKQCRDSGNVRRYREVFGGSGGGGGGSGSAAGSGSGEAAFEAAPELSSPGASSLQQQQETEHRPSEFGFAYDSQFVSTTDQTSAMHLETLEARLSTAQAHLAKEAIRTAYLALGEFHRCRGELREALRRVLRSRDFCTSNRQSGQVCLLVIELGIDGRNYSQVRDYVTKAEHTSDLLHTDPLFASKLRVASALVFMSDGRYADAARKLAAVSADLTHQFNTVVSAEDVALYGALLGLATLDRNELQSLILDSPNFKGRLELVPPLRDALRHYVRAEYGPCLSLLSGLKADLQLDLHLRPHAEKLFNMIRDRCVVQYFTPYSKVSLHTMGKCFSMDVDQMEGVVADLLKSGKIRGARINSLDKTLKAESAKSAERRRRRATRDRVARLGTQFLSETEGMVLRLSCIENDLVVQNDGRKGGGGGGGGGWRGSGRMRNRGGGMGGGYDAGGNIMYGIENDSSDDDVEGGDHHMMDMDVAMAMNPEDV